MSQQGAKQTAGGTSTSLEQIAQLLRGNPKQAAIRAKQLLKSFPGQRDALALFVDAKRLAGDIAGARIFLTAQAVEYPKLAAYHYALGLLLAEAGEIENAIPAFSRATVLEPAHAEAWRALGDVLSDAQRGDEARTAYREYLRLCIAKFRQRPEVGG